MSDFEFSFSKPSQSPAVRRNKEKLRVLVLGNFCGHQESIQPLSARSPALVDIDNFDQVLSKLAPTAIIADEQSTETVRIMSLEDFSPDSLFTKLPGLTPLREQRKRIKSGDLPYNTEEISDLDNQENTENKPESADEAVSRLLRGQSDTTTSKRPGGLLDNFINNLVANDQLPANGDVNAHLAGCDNAIGERIRNVLHTPSFANLEANWRGLYELINIVEEEELVDVALLHATADELTDDLCNGSGEPSVLVTKLVEEASGSFGGQAWDVLVMCDDYRVANANLVAALGAVSKAAGGKLLVNISSSEFTQDVPAVWNQLRSFEAANAIHIVSPLVLARPPYGAQFDAPDSFDFEECTSEPEFDDLVWGSSAMVVASCLIQAHQSGGARGNLSDQSAAQFRPQFTFERDGVKVMQAVAEQLLSDSQAEQLRAKWGIMPVRAQLNGNRLLFVALQSLQAK